jgi:hypothetical protein
VLAPPAKERDEFREHAPGQPARRGQMSAGLLLDAGGMGGAAKGLEIVPRVRHRQPSTHERVVGFQQHEELVHGIDTKAAAVPSGCRETLHSSENAFTRLFNQLPSERNPAAVTRLLRLVEIFYTPSPIHHLRD